MESNRYSYYITFHTVSYSSEVSLAMSTPEDAYAPLMPLETRTSYPGPIGATSPLRSPIPEHGLPLLREKLRRIPSSARLPKTDTSLSRGYPPGLQMRSSDNENLVIFRKVLGINGMDGCTLEDSQCSTIGIYKTVITTQRRKCMKHVAMGAFIYTYYFAQIVIGVAFTATGAWPNNSDCPSRS